MNNYFKGFLGERERGFFQKGLLALYLKITCFFLVLLFHARPGAYEDKRAVIPLN